jgi:hypothetical protein
LSYVQGEGREQGTLLKGEIGLATMAYNLNRMTNVLGASKKLTKVLHYDC